MMEEIFGVSVNFTDGSGDLSPFYQDNTCFPPIQAVKKRQELTQSSTESQSIMKWLGTMDA